MASLDYSKDFLRRLNRVTIDGVPIYTFFEYQGYSLWGFFQHLLWDDIKKFSNTNTTHHSSSKIPTFFNWSALVSAFFIGGMSVFAFVRFLFLKPKALIYGIDVVSGDQKIDFRMGKIYAYLQERRIRYGEVLHTNFRSSVISKALKRGRPVIYLESSRLFYHFLKLFGWQHSFQIKHFQRVALDEFSKPEKLFAIFLIKKYSHLAEISVLKTRFFYWILRRIRPKFFFFIDDVRYYHELLLAARQAGVRTYAFQHSRFNEYLPGWLYYGIPPELCIVPDVFFVWNEYWREKLLNMSPAFRRQSENIMIGGRAYLRKPLHFTETVQDELTTILIPYERMGSVREISLCIEKLLVLKNIRIIFKLRPDQPRQAQLKRFNVDGGHPRLSLISELDEKMLQKVDLVIATHSTMLYEMVEAGKAIGVLKSPNTQARDLVEDGLATELDADTDLQEQIRKAVQIPQEVLRARSKELRVSKTIEKTLDELFHEPSQ